MTDDASLIPTNTLIEELMKRSDHAVLIMYHERSDDTHRIRRRWVGNAHTASGMAMDMCRWILEDLDDRAEEIDPEDLA